MFKIIALSVFGIACIKKPNPLLTAAAKDFLYVLENKQEYNTELEKLTQKEIEENKSQTGFTPSAPPAWEHQLFFKTNSFVDTYEKFGDLTNQSYVTARKIYDAYVSFNPTRLPNGNDCTHGGFDPKSKQQCANLFEEKNRRWWQAVNAYQAIAVTVVATQP